MLAYATARVPTKAGIVLVVGGIGAALLGLVLWRGLDELLAWSLTLLGIAYTVSLLLHGRGVDGAAPLVAAGLLVCAELAAWSLEERYPVAAETRVVVARLWALAGLVGAGLAASALVVALAAAPAGAGLAWTVLGAAAAVLVVAVASHLVRRAH